MLNFLVDRFLSPLILAFLSYFTSYNSMGIWVGALVFWWRTPTTGLWVCFLEGSCLGFLLCGCTYFVYFLSCSQMGGLGGRIGSFGVGCACVWSRLSEWVSVFSFGVGLRVFGVRVIFICYRISSGNSMNCWFTLVRLQECPSDP